MIYSVKNVQFIPKELDNGILYVSEKFSTASHLCACGCGSKVVTPLGPTEWEIRYSTKGPSLYPSIGNWQIPCQSHYWIQNGRTLWAEKWTIEQIESGRKLEFVRREAFVNKNRRRRFFSEIWRKISQLFD